MLLLFSLLGSLASCNFDMGGEVSTGSGKSDESLNLITNKKSDYIIVYNQADADGYFNALALSELIRSVCGVGIEIKNQSQNYGHELLVGNTDRALSSKAKAMLDSETSFAFCASEDGLAFCATDRIAFRKLLVIFRESYLKPGFRNGSLRLSNQLRFASKEKDAEALSVGATLDLIEKGRSKYTIVCDYEDPNTVCAAHYLQSVLKKAYGTEIPVKADTGSYKQEIVVGKSADRTLTSTANTLLSNRGTEDFVFLTDETSAVLTATNEAALLKAVLWFEDTFVSAGTKSLQVRESDLYGFAQTGGTYTIRKDIDFVSIYRETYGTYGSNFELLLYSPTSPTISAEDKKDQLLIEALKDRLGDAAVLYVGSSNAVVDRYFVKLDPKDYSKKAVLKGNSLYVPAAFAKSYLKTDLKTDANGYVDLTAFCSASAGSYTLYRYNSGNLFLLLPKSVTSFAEPDRNIGGYTNRQYLNRLLKFYQTNLPEPVVPVEQTRTVITHFEYPDDVLNWKLGDYTTGYSPSIVKVRENGKTVLYVSHEACRVVNNEEAATQTFIKKSTDGGKTWKKVGEVKELRWASLFELNGRIYLAGNNRATGAAVLARLNADGTTEASVIAEGVGGGGPSAVLVANGRVYKAYNNCVVSADVKSDLMNASNWRQSGAVSAVFTVEWLKRVTGNASLNAVSVEEANVVLGKDGQIYVVYRLNSAGINHAAILKLSKDGKTVSAETKCDSFITLPTTQSKFTIRYDEETQLYFAITSTYYAGPVYARTVLNLIYSSDLIHWKDAGILLVDRELMNPVCSAYAHGIQYIDFVMDGEDIVFVAREAYGYTNCWHDGNDTAFYRLADFREMLK